jgi:hypothetical protein
LKACLFGHIVELSRVALFTLIELAAPCLVVKREPWLAVVAGLVVTTWAVAIFLKAGFALSTIEVGTSQAT